MVQRGEYEWATHTNERTAASYFPHNFEPVVAAGQFDFVSGETRDLAGHPVAADARDTRRTTRAS